MIRGRLLGSVVVAALTVTLFVAPSSAAVAESFPPISGEGSTLAQNAMDLWRRGVAEQAGVPVFYSGVGSAAGRADFVRQAVDFAVTDMPFQTAPDDGSEPEVPITSYASVPLIGQGLALAYNLRIDGKAVTDLRLSGVAVAGIFAGSITMWNDPILRGDNPGVALPARAIVPVVRSDSAGTSLQLTRWMAREYPGVWTHGASTRFPAPGGSFKAQSGSLGVVGYVSQSYGEDSITYVENSYALKADLSVAKIANASGYYVAPTPNAVSIALRGATNADGADVGRSTDPRAYPLSVLTTMIVPTETTRVFSPDKGASLSAFLGYALCRGQQDAAALGNAPLPLERVQAASAAVEAIPGSPGGIDLGACANPTFVPGDTADSSLLTRSALMPPVNDQQPERGAVTTADANVDVKVTASDLFQLTAPVATASVDFGGVRADQSSAARALGRFTVVDDRRALTGWTMQISVAEFTEASDAAKRIPASAVGYTPHNVDVPAGVTMGAAQVAGAAVYPAVLASGVPGTSTSAKGATFDADFMFHAPPQTPVGSYRSTLTLTLIAH